MADLKHSAACLAAGAFVMAPLLMVQAISMPRAIIGSLVLAASLKFLRSL